MSTGLESYYEMIKMISIIVAYVAAYDDENKQTIKKLENKKMSEHSFN